MFSVLATVDKQTYALDFLTIAPSEATLDVPE